MLRPEETGMWPGHSEASPQLWGLPAPPGTRHWAGGLHPSSPLNPSSNPGRPVLLMSQKGKLSFRPMGSPFKPLKAVGGIAGNHSQARGPLRVHTPGPAFPLVNTANVGGAFQPPHLRPSPAPGSSERQDFHSQKCRRREDQTVLSMCQMAAESKEGGSSGGQGCSGGLPGGGGRIATGLRLFSVEAPGPCCQDHLGISHLGSFLGCIRFQPPGPPRRLEACCPRWTCPSQPSYREEIGAEVLSAAADQVALSFKHHCRPIAPRASPSVSKCSWVPGVPAFPVGR